MTAVRARGLRVGEVLETHPNPWSRPEMPMVMEGPVSDEDVRRMVAETKAELAAWRPSAESWELLDTPRAQVGCRVEIQAWDDFMVFFDDEAAFPIRARLLAIERPLGKDGLPSPTMTIGDVSVVPTQWGWDGRAGLLRPGLDAETFVFEVARLFSVKRLRGK